MNNGLSNFNTGQGSALYPSKLKLSTMSSDGIKKLVSETKAGNSDNKVENIKCDASMESISLVSDKDAWQSRENEYQNQKLEAVQSFNYEQENKGKTRLESSLENAFLATSKGVASFGENIFDSLAIIGTGVVSIPTGLYDLGQYALSDDNWHSKTISMWNSTKRFVQQENVENSFNSFYNNYYGKRLNEEAYSPFKTDGVGYQIAEGIGEVAGVIGTAVATGGTSIAGQAAIAGTASFGKNTANAWNNGKGTVEGIAYGGINATWDAGQWYIGGKISIADFGLTNKVTQSGSRIALDTITAAVEAPYKALMDSWMYDKSLKQSWQDNGGLQGMAVQAGIGLVGSAIGEGFDLKKYLKNDNSSNIDNKVTKDVNINSETKNIIDPEHGFQLNNSDLGAFYSAKLKQGFFTEEQISNILNNINKIGYLDESTGEILKSLFDGNSQIYIKTIARGDLSSIMDEGIRCLGSTTSGYGVVPKSVSEIRLENTVTKVTDGGMLELVTRLKGANGLSQGGNIINGAVILKIPNDIEFENIFKYNNELGMFSIDPKYNVGFIGCDVNANLTSIQK